MSYYRYGKEEKKITFADTDKRHAELRLKLRRDGISQVDFFKSMVTGYINDPNILVYITKVKQEKVKLEKAIKQNEDIKQGNQTLQDLGITERDIDFVFDLIEKEKMKSNELFVVECALKCKEKKVSCPNTDCRMWIDYEQENIAALFLSKKGERTGLTRDLHYMNCRAFRHQLFEGKQTL